MLRDIAEGKPGYGPPASEVVRRAVKKHKIKMVPIETAKVKPVLNDFFSTPATAYVPCLIDSIALVEAGPGVVKARSVAWAQRRVTDVMRSPANKVWDSCQPPAIDNIARADFRGQVRSLLAQPQLTVAVVELDCAGASRRPARQPGRSRLRCARAALEKLTCPRMGVW
jgi:hypothetical protein